MIACITNVAVHDEVSQQKPMSVEPVGQQIPFGGLAPKEVRPSELLNTVSPPRTTVGRWADAEDDDDFDDEEGELQPGRVEVVYDDILAVDEALQTAAKAFIEVGKCNRG
ncbi:hypothetical protein NE237_001205 [Protea cynaroides]|uniref:Uncharacterized protein n=1 Tax=Protea cynaroides TaxID=273540 RepID=A0A9Q0KT26_9MAGN|nr:hypothetical protein NE237_001205 [Protea cynaroides]